MESTPVIFRKHYDRDSKTWDVTAAFPELPADSSSWYNMTCYAHIGRHGSCSPDWFRAGKLATPDERADLYRELSDIYEKDSDAPTHLVIRQRETRAMRQEREKAWRAFRSGI